MGSPWYAAIGPSAGKYNGSSAASTLTVQLSQTVQRSTTVEVGASMKVSWGISEVQANTKYAVTSTTSTGVTVTDQVVVPGHQYGYAQAKVEYRRFHIYRVQELATCATRVTKDYGYLDAITTYPFFSECVSTKACTPKP